MAKDGQIQVKEKKQPKELKFLRKEIQKGQGNISISSPTKKRGLNKVEEFNQELLNNSNNDEQPNMGSSEVDNNSVLGNSDLAIQKKYFAYEEALKKRAGIYPFISLIAVYLISVTIIIGVFYLIMSTISNNIQISSLKSDITFHFDIHGFEVFKFYNRLLKKIALEEGIAQKNRYFKKYLIFRYAKFNFSE